MAISIDVLPASRGDSLWVECARPGREPWRLLIDGGMPESYAGLRRHLETVARSGSLFIDLLVVSHIDTDHVGGLLALLEDQSLDVSFGDIWFNGPPHLPAALPSTAVRSVAEGERLAHLLADQLAVRPRPWNERFARRAVATADDQQLLAIEFASGPTLTLLSPTPRRLQILGRKWVKALRDLHRGAAAEPPPKTPAVLDDLLALAATKTSLDASPTNGSSIAFLLEYRGRSCLFAADAFANVLGPALTTLARARGDTPIDIDVFKLPHHGSEGNVTNALLDLVPAQHYVISTDGSHFQHPDDIALARVVTRPHCARKPPILWFNHATEIARRWADPMLNEKYGFSTRLPAPERAGIRIELPPGP